jgi:hypothetical protein
MAAMTSRENALLIQFNESLKEKQSLSTVAVSVDES